MTAILATTGAIRSLVDGTLRLTVDIEPKDAQAAFALFGKPGSPVALARIKDAAAVEHDRRQQAAPAAPPAERKAVSIASKVAIACQDPEFHEFLRSDLDGFCERWDAYQGVPDPERAERCVKWWCQVERKRDIDADHRSLGRWRELHRDYQNWLGSRELARRTGRAA